jgi:hypothetical protein
MLGLGFFPVILTVLAAIILALIFLVRTAGLGGCTLGPCGGISGAGTGATGLDLGLNAASPCSAHM